MQAALHRRLRAVRARGFALPRAARAANAPIRWVDAGHEGILGNPVAVARTLNQIATEVTS